MQAVWKQRKGKIELVTGMYLLVMLIILLAVQFQLKLFMNISSFMEDALAASNLASAVIDIREYGTTGILQIADPDAAYRLYREAVRQNLQLDDNWENSNKDLIAGQVEILKYEIYNVNKKDIIIYSFGEEGQNVRIVTGGLGSVRTPDGTLVESTSVYSKITFPVKGFFGVQVQAQKHKTVDIVTNLEMTEEEQH